MATPRELLAERLKLALGSTCSGAVPEVVPATDSRFGDYQSNIAMVLARELKTSPRRLAEDISKEIDARDIAESPTVAGAGFINFRLTDSFLAREAAAIAKDERLGVGIARSTERIIIDFSSPNVAKPMHVGHIRSTILGDCLARTARFLGHEVITDNHLGDWGTQFGKLIYGWKHFLDEAALEKNAITELVRLYRNVNELEATREDVRTEVRKELVKLQQGDRENGEIWRRAVELSWREFEKLYDLLGIRFDQRLGESFYNDALGPLCERLASEGVAEMSDGALCIFFRDIPALEEKPMIIRKSDGGFLYSTTDLATIEYRVRKYESFRDLVCGRCSPGASLPASVRRSPSNGRYGRSPACRVRQHPWRGSKDHAHACRRNHRSCRTPGGSDRAREGHRRGKKPFAGIADGGEDRLGDRPRRDQIRRTLPTSDDRLRLLLVQTAFVSGKHGALSPKCLRANSGDLPQAGT